MCEITATSHHIQAVVVPLGHSDLYIAILVIFNHEGQYQENMLTQNYTKGQHVSKFYTEHQLF